MPLLTILKYEGENFAYVDDQLIKADARADMAYLAKTLIESDDGRNVDHIKYEEYKESFLNNYISDDDFYNEYIDNIGDEDFEGFLKTLKKCRDVEVRKEEASVYLTFYRNGYLVNIIFDKKETVLIIHKNGEDTIENHLNYICDYEDEVLFDSLRSLIRKYTK